jgi:hypothetical protein
MALIKCRCKQNTTWKFHVKGVHFALSRPVLGIVTAGFCFSLPSWHRLCLENRRKLRAPTDANRSQLEEQGKENSGNDAGTGNGNRELVVVVRNDRIA